MAIKLANVITYIVRPPPIKSHNLLKVWSRDVTLKIKFSKMMT